MNVKFVVSTVYKKKFWSPIQRSKNTNCLPKTITIPKRIEKNHKTSTIKKNKSPSRNPENFNTETTPRKPTTETTPRTEPAKARRKISKSQSAKASIPPAAQRKILNHWTGRVLFVTFITIALPLIRQVDRWSRFAR